MMPQRDRALDEPQLLCGSSRACDVARPVACLQIIHFRCAGKAYLSSLLFLLFLYPSENVQPQQGYLVRTREEYARSRAPQISDCQHQFWREAKPDLHIPSWVTTSFPNQAQKHPHDKQLKLGNGESCATAPSPPQPNMAIQSAARQWNWPVSEHTVASFGGPVWILIQHSLSWQILLHSGAAGVPGSAF